MGTYDDQSLEVLHVVALCGDDLLEGLLPLELGRVDDLVRQLGLRGRCEGAAAVAAGGGAERAHGGRGGCPFRRRRWRRLDGRRRQPQRQAGEVVRKFSYAEIQKTVSNW